MKYKYAKPAAVRVTDAYFRHALELDVDNLLILESDRLLAGFRETAALIAGMNDEECTRFMKNKKRYGGGWEDALIGGHTLGHYLTAVAQGVINPGLDQKDRDALKERLDEIVEALAECQKMTEGTEYEGYLFGAAIVERDNLDAQFDHVEAMETNIVTQAWVPWYTMHKILAGLTDAYAIAGSRLALDVANRLAVWISNRANGWSDELQKTVLATEYGGMNDALYQLYQVTDAPEKEEFLKAAHKFDEVELFEKVYHYGENVLNGIHANTTIPKFLGALSRYETDNSETRYLAYAEKFWQMVIERQTYITGGNSEDEHFGADYALNDNRTNCNNETCNTYNMLKLSRRLFCITGEKKYADYYENTLINAILSSQDHKTGRTMYFQPMATGFQKIFGSVDNSFWCCTGSGMENFTKLQDSIYFEADGVTGINLYVASEYKKDGFVIRQSGDLTKKEEMTISVSGTPDSDLYLRIPYWVKGAAEIRMENGVYEPETVDGYYVIPKEKLQDNKSFTIFLPMEVRAENLPDSKDTYAFRYGPFVLSAALGTDKQGVTNHGVTVLVPAVKAVKRDRIGIRNAASVEEFIGHINENLVKKEGELTFTLQGTAVSYTFTPHYDQDEQSYGIYWTYYVDEDGIGAEAVLEEKESGRIREMSVDRIEQAGRGQYEARFILPDGSKAGLVDNGSTGEDAPALTRRAKAGGSFGYKMIAPQQGDALLILTFAKNEEGRPVKICVGDHVIASETLCEKKWNGWNLTLADADRDAYYQAYYAIPEEVIQAEKEELIVVEQDKEVTHPVITVEFSGTENEESARICKSVWLIRKFRTENRLVTVQCDGKEITPDADGVYTVTTPYDEDPKVLFTMEDPAGYLMLEGTAFDDREPKKLVTLAAKEERELTVVAQNFEPVQRVKIRVVRDYSALDAQKNLVRRFGFDGSLDGAVWVTKADKLQPAENVEAVYAQTEDGKALVMDGTCGLELLADPSVLGKSYTISFFMKPDQAGACYDPTIAGGNFAQSYWLNLTLDGKMWSNNRSRISSPAAECYQAGQWQQVILTVDGEKKGHSENTVYGELYCNGIKVNSGTIAADLMLLEGGGLYFGINPWDAVFKGQVKDICLYDRNFTEKEIQGLVKFS